MCVYNIQTKGWLSRVVTWRIMKHHLMGVENVVKWEFFSDFQIHNARILFIGEHCLFAERQSFRPLQIGPDRRDLCAKTSSSRAIDKGDCRSCQSGRWSGGCWSGHWSLAYVHGDARSTKNYQSNSDQLHAWWISGQSQNQIWIFDSFKKINKASFYVIF